MKQAVVAVFDRAAQLFGRPFFVAAKGQAIRSFTDEINRKDGERSEFSKHPQDFDLFLLSTYDDEQGSFTPEQQLLVRGVDVLIKEQ